MAIQAQKQCMGLSWLHAVRAGCAENMCAHVCVCMSTGADLLPNHLLPGFAGGSGGGAIGGLKGLSGIKIRDEDMDDDKAGRRVSV